MRWLAYAAGATTIARIALQLRLSDTQCGWHDMSSHAPHPELPGVVDIHRHLLSTQVRDDPVNIAYYSAKAMGPGYNPVGPALPRIDERSGLAPPMPANPRDAI